MDMDAIEIIKPVFVMGLLTLVMVIMLFVTRIPAMQRLQIHPNKGRNPSDLAKLLPESATRVANNYNHLFEQPTLFYAVCISLALIDHVDAIHVICAWSFVFFRVLHSVVQSTIDHVTTRFILFIGSWIALAIMVTRESILLFTQY